MNECGIVRFSVFVGHNNSGLGIPKDLRVNLASASLSQFPVTFVGFRKLRFPTATIIVLNNRSGGAQEYPFALKGCSGVSICLQLSFLFQALTELLGKPINGSTKPKFIFWHLLPNTVAVAKYFIVPTGLFVE